MMIRILQQRSSRAMPEMNNCDRILFLPRSGTRTDSQTLWQAVRVTGQAATHRGKPSGRPERLPHIVARISGDWTGCHTLWQGFLAPGKAATHCGKDFWRPDGLPHIVASRSGDWTEN
jgi:hypothetical protein